MIERDHLMRQVQQLAQVLAVLLGLQRAGRSDEAQEALAHGLRDATGRTLGELRDLGRDELLALCSYGDVLSSEQALALADLLREDRSGAGRERALWLYEAVREAGDLAPLDLPERIAALRSETPGSETPGSETPGSETPGSGGAG